MGILNFLCNTMVFQTLFKNKSAIEKLKLHSALLWPGLDLTLLSLTDAHK